MPSGMTLLSNYPVMRTSDAEYARDQILSVFDATSFEVPKGENRFEVCANHLQVGDLRLYYCAYAGDVSIGFGEVPFVRQIFNVSGKVRYSGRHLSGEVAQGSCSQILPAGIPLKFDFKSSYRHLVLRIEQDALQRYLAARIAIMKLLMYSRHNYTHFLFRKPPTSNSSAVKTVEEFIEANWEKPIDIEAMSAIAKISARSLFRQFKQDRGYSPGDFAKRIRLDRAREMLEQAEGNTSVTQIVLKCGFQNPGHFARDFHLAFGELPSDTLRRSGRCPIL